MKARLNLTLNNKCSNNLLRKFLLLVTLVAGPCFAGAEEQTRLHGFKIWLDAHRLEHGIPSLSVVILKDQEVMFAEGLGFSDDEREFATTLDTTYYIASITKPLAAIAVLSAVEKGFITLDTPLSRSADWASFCGWFESSGIIFAGAQIEDELTIPPFRCSNNHTLRDALNHRVNGTPGSAFVYNPIIYARIGRLFPQADSGDFRTMIREAVLNPSGMHNAAAGWRDPVGGQALTNLAQPFKVQDGRLEKVPLPDDDLRAAAGVYTSAMDLARFDIALDSGLLLKRDTLLDIWQPDLDASGKEFPYKLGWYTQLHKGHRLHWHSGWQPEAYSALYLKVPERRLTLIALANSEGLWWGNPLNAAEVQNSPLAAKFLELMNIE